MTHAFSDRRMDDTVRRFDTLPFQTIDFGSWSTDMLLSLLTSESASDWHSLLRSRCTRLTNDMTRLVFENLTLGCLPPFLIAGLGCCGDGLVPSVPWLLMKCAFLSSADPNVLPHPGSKHLVEVHHLVPCWVLLQFLHGCLAALPFGELPCLPGDCWYSWLLTILAAVFAATC